MWLEIPWKTESSSQAQEDEITIMWEQCVISKQQRMKCSKVTTPSVLVSKHSFDFIFVLKCKSLF